MMCTTFFFIFFFSPIFFTFNQKVACVCVCVCVWWWWWWLNKFVIFCKVVWEWQIKRHLAMVQPSRITFAAQKFFLGRKHRSIYLSIFLVYF
ncbi:hypothetical protein MG7_05513 [Candida albicans P34048]|nr:hypothetical protein MG7_05513 [Candida albicans P34048]